MERKMALEDPTAMASLYVGDLHPGVTENDLAETFGRVGPLLSVHVCRDKISRKSLCYAYVNFWFRCHASTALKCLNHTRLKGKSLRIMWCERNPMSRKNSMGNLFVKNLDLSITGARLQEIFSKYGTIVSCKVAEEKGISKGFGFVQFDSEDSAVAALNDLHDTMLQGKKLYVSKFLRRAERMETESSLNNLFVTNLDDYITEDLLKDKFSKHGKVASVAIIKDEKGKLKGYGFVNFDSHEGAKQAMEALDGELLGSKKISVVWAERRAETVQDFRQLYGYKCMHRSVQSKGANLYVKNLNPSIDNRKLNEFFSRYGKVVSAKVIRNGDGISKKYGFVRFLCPDEAIQALNSVTGTSFDGRTLHVALAQRQEQQACKFQKSFTKFPPQQQYISNFRPPNCSFPYYSPLVPIMKINQWDPNFYQDLAGPFLSSNSYQAQDFQGISNTLPLQGAAIDMCRQHNYAEFWMQAFCQSQNKITGDVKEYFKGHGAMQTSLMIPSPEVSKAGGGYMCHSLVRNLQPGLAASGHALQLEMESVKSGGC